MSSLESKGMIARDEDIPLLSGVAALAEYYQGFIVDLWGVLHNGVAAYPHAVSCLHELNKQGKSVVALSNAPRRASEVTERNGRLGLPNDCIDAVVSSGEETWQHLFARPDAWYRALGRRCFHLGPERDYGMRDGLDLDFTEDLDASDFILLTGALGYEDSLSDYEAFLQSAHARALPLICANPDLVVMRGEEMEICAGAIAERYRELGGEVRMHGKPDPEIYARCFAAFGDLESAKICALGDSPRTDLAGARRVGIDGYFVAGGIHAEELVVRDGRVDPARIGPFFASSGERPAGVLASFAW